jgi:hypothetical protein
LHLRTLAADIDRHGRVAALPHNNPAALIEAGFFSPFSPVLRATRPGVREANKRRRRRAAHVNKKAAP